MIISVVERPSRCLSLRDCGRFWEVLGGLAKTLGSERADLLVRGAAVGVVAWDIGLTAKILLLAWDVAPVNRLAVLGCLGYLPLSVILVVRGIRNNGSQSSRRILAVLAVVVFGALPFAGPEWPPLLALVAGFGLIFVKQRRALLLFAACVVAADTEAVVWTARSPATAAVHWYGGEFASYDSVDIVWTGVALAVLIVLARTLGELQAARRQLAAQALVVERQRIDGELARTIGAALELIIASGDAAAGLVRENPQAAARELRALTARSRTTLADARSVLSRYRCASLEAELGAVTTLLAAAGIRAAVVLPDGDLPAQLPESVRRRLRAAVTSALTAGAATECRIVISRDRAGELDIQITGELGAAGKAVA
jgi:signal transduction histidine kinase